MQYSFTTYYQIFGATLAIITIALDTREKVIARPLSIASTIVTFFVYYSVGLYAKCLQCVFNVFFHSYGWYQWLYGGKHKTPLQISQTKPRTLVRLLFAGALSSAALGSFLDRYSSADLPYWDSLHTVLALTAHWMLVRKKLESWLLWVAADALYAIVLYYKGLYVICGLYILFIFFASHGYRTWRKSYLEKKITLLTSSEGGTPE